MTESGYPSGTAIANDYTVTKDGGPFASGVHQFTGPAGSVRFELVGDGTYHATVNHYGYRYASSRVLCGPKPPNPVPTPTSRPNEPQKPAQPPKPPTTDRGRKITCAVLKTRGAGRKWLVKYGCITPRRPRTPNVICPPERAGEKWHRRANRLHGCAIPPRFRPPAQHVPVMG